MMTQQERDNRLNELNEICKKCIEKSVREGFGRPDPQCCLSFCQTGREIHKLEDPAWDAQDWNSSKLEGLYHN